MSRIIPVQLSLSIYLLCVPVGVHLTTCRRRVSLGCLLQWRLQCQCHVPQVKQTSQTNEETTTSPSSEASTKMNSLPLQFHTNNSFDLPSIALQVQQLPKLLCDVKSTLRRIEGSMSKPVCHCHIYFVTKKNPYPPTSVKSS